jgi:hypothetical protein
MRTIAVVSIVASFILFGCEGKQPAPPASTDLVKEEKSVAGISWSYPQSWDRSHEMPMRVTTYVIPSGLEDVEPGECSVFYFGKDQGGDVDANIQRWGAQFEGASEAQKTVSSINGLEVVFARISGTYLSPAGPQMETQGKKPGYKLLGAIVSAPEGMVFFKFTAPASIIEKHEQEFYSMIESTQKQ